jgi:hypothetical protein
VACPSDRRATNARLTDAGWDKVVAAAPGHVEKVREQVIDRLTPEQLEHLTEIAGAILQQLSPDAAAWTERYKRGAESEPSAAAGVYATCPSMSEARECSHSAR